MSNVHQDFANWIENLVERSDNFVETAKGCAGLSKAKGVWDRNNSMLSSLKIYDKKTIEAIMVLLKQDNIPSYYSRDYEKEY